MHPRRRHCVFLAAVIAFAVPAGAAALHRARLGTPLPANGAPAALTVTDSTFTCFEAASLVPAVNPGCFVIFDPPQSGDCTAHASHYMLQALRPTLDVPHRLRGFSFRSNDAATVFPGAGILLSPVDATGAFLLPGPAELGTLQAGPVPSGADTAWVFVDLSAAKLVVPAGADTAVLVVLRFPEGGRLVGVGEGPGVDVDASLPDQDCDFFSIDGGATWYAPAYDPGDPLSAPLDWGFVLHWEPATAVQALGWSQVKALYRTP